MLRKLIILVLTCYVLGEKENQMREGQENKRMVGVDTVHADGVNKDASVSKPMKTGKRKFGKNSHDHNKGDSVPDWSYSSFPKEISAHVEQFKRNMSECLKEVQADTKKTVQRLSPKKDSPVHGDCLIACVLKRNGVIQHGKIHKDNLLSLVNKFYAKDTQLMKKLEKQVDRCIDSSSRLGDDCALAAQLNDCTNRIMANNKHKIIVNY